MRKVCVFCQRTAPDNNLICQEPYCLAERSPYILDPGEWLGDIEIIRPIRVLRAAALYQARRGREALLLKIAHPGDEHTERLKREAEVLRALAGEKQAHPGLPQLLPPYTNSSLEKHAYGRAVLQGHLLYYCLFAQFDGAPLSEVLIDRPQLWVYHVGWIVADVAAAVATLQGKGMYHYGLRPEIVLVRFDERASAPAVLLWDLGVSADRTALPSAWYPELVPPAYTAPELIGAGPLPVSYAVDVYGFGLILYELLNGAPAFPHRLTGDAEVYKTVLDAQELRSGRAEDVQGVADLSDRCTSRTPARRPQSAAELAAALTALFDQPPTPQPSWMPSARVALTVVAVALLLAFLVTTGISVSQLISPGAG